MFSGKVILVTGASSGIGRATALAFAQQGARVVVNYRSDQAGASETQKEVDRLGGSAFVMQGDVGREEDVRGMVETITADIGRISVLVNNAAVYSHGNFLDMPLEVFDQVALVNTRGVFYLSQLVARGMAERREGSIILVSSILASVVIPGMSAYCASKGALESMARSMALDLAEYNIRVNVVRPGLIRTKMLLDTMPDETLQADVQRYIPGGRFGSPEEIAETVLFLASDRASYISGAVVAADGGLGVRESGPLVKS